MADPATLAIVGMAGTAAGGLIQGIGASTSANATAAASTYKAGVAKLNQQINLQNAEFATESGAISAEESGLKSAQEIGETKVTQAASGLDVNSGTAKAVRDTQVSVAGFDQSVIQWDAAKTAYGYEAKAATDVAEANLDLMAASSEKTGGTLSMISSFLNSGSSVASKWSQAKSEGIFK